jgi:hypothetical protein
VFVAAKLKFRMSAGEVLHTSVRIAFKLDKEGDR